MARKSTGLEEPFELARRINRWPALRNKPGDEKAYQLARAVQKLYKDVQANAVEIEAGLEELAPLMQEINQVEGGGGLFDEARGLAATLRHLKLNITRSTSPLPRP